MKMIKDFMFDMFSLFMPFFSYNLIFSLVVLAIAGLVVLIFKDNAGSAKAIRAGAWLVLSIIALMFVLNPIIRMFQFSPNNFDIVSPFIHLGNYNKLMNSSGTLLLFGFIPYVIILVSLLIVLFKPAATALSIGRFLLVMGIVFILCQITGNWLGANAAVNFGDFSGIYNEKGQWQNMTVLFWKLGVGMILVGSVLAIMGRVSRDREILDA